MANWTYELVTDPTKTIPNATVYKGYADGTFRVYTIEPNDGYVLHDTNYDTVEYEVDEETGNVIEISRILGYRTTTASCGYNYDFSTSIVTDDNGVTHTAYGSRQFFAVPADSVPENQIYDITNPPEIM